MIYRLLVTSLLLVAPAFARADSALQTFLDQTLANVQRSSQVPAIAALIQINGRIEAESAVGVRALGHHEAVTIDDRWHIVSDTKAFTSLLIARLVEAHVMSFDDTLAQSFPALTKNMDPVYRDVTV